MKGSHKNNKQFSIDYFLDREDYPLVFDFAKSKFCSSPQTTAHHSLM